jgi:hypothetical protein
MNITLRVVIGEVLGVDVVVDLAEVTLVTGLVANDLVGVSAALFGQGFGGRRWVLEANEAIAA